MAKSTLPKCTLIRITGACTLLSIHLVLLSLFFLSCKHSLFSLFIGKALQSTQRLLRPGKSLVSSFQFSFASAWQFMRYSYTTRFERPVSGISIRCTAVLGEVPMHNSPERFHESILESCSVALVGVTESMHKTV